MRRAWRSTQGTGGRGGKPRTCPGWRGRSRSGSGAPRHSRRANHRQDGRRRELVVEIHEDLEGVCITAELPEDVVPGLGDLFAGAGGLLDVIEGAEGLLELLFLEIQAQEVVQDFRLFGELRKDALVHLDDHVVLTGGLIEVRQAALVPVVVRVQLRRLAEMGDGGVGIPQHRLVQAQVVPDGVVVGSRLGEGLEQGA